MRVAIDSVLAEGRDVEPSKGPTTELLGVLLELTNPRARLSRSESRGVAFSCLGELCWYLSGSEDRDFISYYIPWYEKNIETDRVPGAYGPRLFPSEDASLLDAIIVRLRSKPSSRRAVIPLYRANDLTSPDREVPCTCTLQFLLRDDRLNLVVYMRSNDAVYGLPHDIFSFTMMQEIVATSLEVDMGWYRHCVGSLHVYRDKRSIAKAFLDEGWQSTLHPMPPMPHADPLSAVDSLLAAEQLIRSGSPHAIDRLGGMHPYWADLARLLLVHRALKGGDMDHARGLKDTFHDGSYHGIVDSKLHTIRK